jgi:hypothetical protein
MVNHVEIVFQAHYSTAVVILLSETPIICNKLSKIFKSACLPQCGKALVTPQCMYVCMWYHMLFLSTVMRSGSHLSWSFQIWGAPLYNKNCVSVWNAHILHTCCLWLCILCWLWLFIYCRYKQAAAELLIVWNHNYFFLYFVKCPPYWTEFQLKVLDLNEIYIFCSVAYFLCYW